jgi:hypothetical protein
VTLSDTFFVTSQSHDDPTNETFSTMAAMVTTSLRPPSPTQTASLPSNDELSDRTSIENANHLTNNTTELYTDERYSTSPFVEFNSDNLSDWPGLDQVKKDLVSLFQNTRSWNSSAPWKKNVVNSTDWYTLDFDECLDTFSIRYRPYAGTVFLVLGMIDMVNIKEVENEILGLSYLSHRVSSLSFVCPTAYANLSQSGLSQEINDALVRPLLYGTFDKPSPTSFKPKTYSHFGTSEEWRTCPKQGDDTPQVPLVKGCLLRNRTYRIYS